MTAHSTYTTITIIYPDVLLAALHSPLSRVPPHCRRPHPRPHSSHEVSNPRSTTSLSKSSLSSNSLPYSPSWASSYLVRSSHSHLSSASSQSTPLRSPHSTLFSPFTPFSAPHSLFSLSPRAPSSFYFSHPLLSLLAPHILLSSQLSLTSITLSHTLSPPTSLPLSTHPLIEF
ncbi:conserved hypothetical protein (plasmid) [Haloterrigena turkmenica DSM 5511]|uniref:Uncharacterized protein n=1 Tax=Haloterrigena turkmenica (strain ATCC 51198 / DSM 5511 / JCM 9101 / NCIMB 13204 / VKM B-1734 / 4k) TaxID=543526 RepID=D2S2X3_HALTV|nr:conserved hypothetical protein [Haloterrigena turkmenica DSM 5511]